jgi:RimJ/RimL family protein N-acetyltransferase
MWPDCSGRNPTDVAKAMASPIDVSALDDWITPARSRRGAVLRIRPLRPDDREREIAFINALSARSRYFRLFTPLKFLPRHLIDQLMDIDYRQRMAFVATTQQGGAEQFVGVARYGETNEPGIAELGVSVADAWQRSGIASLLIQQLVRYAQAQGLRRMIGAVLPDNVAMIALARRLAFTVRYDPAQHLFQISRDLGAADRPLQEQARCTRESLSV